MLPRFRRNHSKNAKFRKFLETVSYEDSDYFSVAEIRFLLQLTAFCSPRSDAKVDRDLRRVTREIKRGKRILPSHASILAKANEYWKLRYNEKFNEWNRKCQRSEQRQTSTSRVTKGAWKYRQSRAGIALVIRDRFWIMGFYEGTFMKQLEG